MARSFDPHLFSLSLLSLSLSLPLSLALSVHQYVCLSMYQSVSSLCLITRSLCVDALIELSDENADWKLSFNEFLNCLRPDYNPPEKSKHSPSSLPHSYGI